MISAKENQTTANYLSPADSFNSKTLSKHRILNSSISLLLQYFINYETQFYFVVIVIHRLGPQIFSNEIIFNELCNTDFGVCTLIYSLFELRNYVEQERIFVFFTKYLSRLSVDRPLKLSITMKLFHPVCCVAPIEALLEWPYHSQFSDDSQFSVEISTCMIRLTSNMTHII